MGVNSSGFVVLCLGGDGVIDEVFYAVVENT